MENKANLAKAVIAVMKIVKGIDKGMTIGTGTNSYKGVADVDVKQAIGEAMEENGLCILPIDVQSKTQIDRWEEEDSYSKSVPKAMKTKQSVFTEVTTKYLLLHESGESIELAGYGHGIDNQDKGAGKATTYALKNALLYTFLVPTKKIDDTDTTHSDNLPVPQNKPATNEPILLWLNENDPNFEAIKQAIKDGKRTIPQLRLKYKISKEIEAKLNA